MKRWPTMPLLEVATIVASRVEPFEGQRRYIATGGLDGGTVIARDEVDFDSKPSRADLVARRNDVLFARMQATNKVFLVTEESQNYIWSTGFAVLRPNANLCSRFLMHYLASPCFQAAKDVHCTGATQKSLPNAGLRQLAIPVPPLAEQERIVKLLDEADELRKLRAQADHRTAALLPALFHEMFGDPLVNSRGWQTKELRQLGRVVTGGTPPSAKEGMFGGEIPFITPGDLESNTRETMRHVTEAGAEEARTMRAGSTLVCCIGATIGKTDRAWKRSAFNQQINAVEWGEEIEDDFGVVCMKQSSKAVIRQGSQTALPILKKSLFEQIRIPIPPLPLQKEFARRVAEIRALEAGQAASRQRLEALFQSLLHRAFNGEL